MSGASLNHNLITSNVLAALHTSLRDSDCFVFGGDMKIQAAESLHYTYPDVSIVCGDVQFVENRDDTIINPVVIIECCHVLRAIMTAEPNSEPTG